jgi:anaphase-promoting complex subunit 2
MEAKRRVFASVFEFSGALSQPTPEVGFTAPGQPFGGPIAVTHDRHGLSESFQRSFRHSTSFVGDTRDQINWDRSWHTATSFLACCLTTVGVDALLPPPSPGLEAAIADVLDPATRLPGAIQIEDLINWYFQQVRHHFLNELLPNLSVVSNTSKLEEILPSCIEVLERGHRLYLHGLDFIVKQLETAEPGSSRPVVQRFRGDLHAIVGNSISIRISVTVKKILAEKVSIVLGVPTRHAVQSPLVRSQVRPETAAREKARNELLGLVQSLHNLGLGGEKLKITFAEVMSHAMSSYIKHTYAQVWSRTSPTANAASMDNVHDSFYPRTEGLVGGSISDRQSLNPPKPYQASASWCVKDLCEWVENEYSVLVLEVLGKLENPEMDWDHVEKWKKMGIGRLAGLRTQELVDIVVNWPNAEGALDDLRTSIDTPQKRLTLTDVFSASLRERLLHPGASTLQILRTYISMIRSFHSLDQSKVLLDRVAYPLQLYLCSREDTVKIIITGLLSDTEDSAGNPIEPGGDKLAELAILLNKGSELGQRADEDLDWNDPEWLPDPVDAGPGYKRSKNVDVIGTLIGVLGSQDVFIKEFQNIVGDHLLRGDGDFEKEVCIVLFKIEALSPFIR